MAPSKFALQFSVYYTCLRLYAHTAAIPSVVSRPHPFLHPSLELTDHVTSHVTSIPATDWPTELLPLVEQLQRYRDRLADHIETEVIQGLRLGVDVKLFTQDPDYRRSSILYLARLVRV